VVQEKEEECKVSMGDPGKNNLVATHSNPFFSLFRSMAEGSVALIVLSGRAAGYSHRQSWPRWREPVSIRALTLSMEWISSRSMLPAI
jgi:hypothetical protein